MTIAVPLTAANEFSVHFGAAVRVGLFRLDRARRRIVRIDTIKPPVRLPCGWADWLGAQGVTVFLAGAISAGALQRMAAGGIKVIAGLRPDAPLTLVHAWLAGRLRPGANGCEAAVLATGASAGAVPALCPAASAAACCCLRGLTRARTDAANLPR